MNIVYRNATGNVRINVIFRRVRLTVVAVNKQGVLNIISGCFYSSQILIKLKNSTHIFEKSSNITFHENPSNGSGVVPCGRTDSHCEAKSLFFRKAANAPKNRSTL